MALIRNIQDLTQLKKSYNLTMTLEDYVTNEITNTFFRLLHRVQLEHMENLVNDFIFVKLNEKGISTLDILVQ